MGSQVKVYFVPHWKVSTFTVTLMDMLESLRYKRYKHICRFPLCNSFCLVGVNVSDIAKLNTIHSETESSSTASGARYASHAHNAHASHASWYGYDPTHEHDAWRPPSNQHAYGYGASRDAAPRPVTWWSTEDGSAESSHGDAAGGESQAAGEILNRINVLSTFF